MNNLILFLGNGFWLNQSTSLNNETSYKGFVNWKINNLKIEYNNIVKNKNFTIWEKLFYICSYSESKNDILFFDIERYIRDSFKILTYYTSPEAMQYKFESKYCFWEMFFNSIKTLNNANRHFRNFLEENSEISTKLTSIKELQKYKVFTLDNQCSKAIAQFLAEIYYHIYDMHFVNYDELNNWLMDEMIKFEKEFELYLSSLKTNFIKNNINNLLTNIIHTGSSAIINYLGNNEHELLENNSNLISSNINTYIIDFNFYNIYENYLETIINLNSILQKSKCNTFKFMQPKLHRDHNKDGNFGYSNIHGCINDASHPIIFGLDDFVTNREQYFYESFIFSKSFRQLYSHSDWQNQSHSLEWDTIPKFANNNRYFLCFYGLSLSNVDYSYYHAVFDKYHLYDSNVSLIFVYSDGPTNEPDKFKNLIIKNAFVLLKDYGNTLDNKFHGKNLITKLRLENRIQFYRIPSSINSLK